MNTLEFKQHIAGGDLAKAKFPSLTATTTPQQARQIAKELAVDSVKEMSEVSFEPGTVFDQQNARPSSIITQRGWAINGLLRRDFNRQSERRT